MQKKWPWLARTLAIAALASSAFFPLTASAAGMTSNFSIAGLGAREMGFEMWTNDSFTNGVVCSNPNTFRILSSYSNYQTIVSTLTTAFATGKTVHLWASGCDTDGVTLFIAAWVNK